MSIEFRFRFPARRVRGVAPLYSTRPGACPNFHHCSVLGGRRSGARLRDQGTELSKLPLVARY